MHGRDDETVLVKKSCLCCHTLEERTLQGKWCTPDIQKDVELGFTLIKIYEVHHFPTEQREVGLFANYINSWLKDKTRVCPIPCLGRHPPEDKARYICQYQQKEGITLDPSLIQKNPGCKAMA